MYKTNLIDLVPFQGIISGATAFHLKHVLIKTLLSSVLHVRADAQLIEARMIGCKLDAGRHGGSDRVPPHGDALPEASAELVRTGCLLIPRVTADAAVSAVLAPLPREAAAVQLVIVVVVRGGEAVTPGGGARGRLDEAAVGQRGTCGAQRSQDEQQNDPLWKKEMRC